MASGRNAGPIGFVPRGRSIVIISWRDKIDESDHIAPLDIFLATHSIRIVNKKICLCIFDLLSMLISSNTLQHELQYIYSSLNDFWQQNKYVSCYPLFFFSYYIVCNYSGYTYRNTKQLCFARSVIDTQYKATHSWFALVWSISTWSVASVTSTFPLLPGVN